jgi:hypothetical protein
VQTMTKELLDKTKKERYGKFDFQWTTFDEKLSWEATLLVLSFI